MSALQVIEDLRARGIEICAVGNRLRWKPKSALTPDESTVLRERKFEILRWLAAAPSAPCRICRGVRYWRHAQHGHWNCCTCHPPPRPALVGEEATVGATDISERMGGEG